MGFVVSGLTDYVDQSSEELISAAQFGNETAAMMNLQTGVKSSKALQLLNVAAYPQVNSSCGFNASGTATLTQRNISTSAIKYEASFCINDLEAKWTQTLIKKGQDYDESDMPKEIMDEVVKFVNRYSETADWQGDSASGDPILAQYDGLLKIIDAATTVSATPSTYNSTNCRTIVAEMITLIPAPLQGDPDFTFFLGYPELETYRQKLMADNLFHVPAGDAVNVITAEGSIYKLKAVHGLDNTSRIIGMKPDNAYLGVDMEGEEEQFRLWYSQDDDLVKYSIKYRRGWQVAIPSEIVEYTNS